MTNRERVTTLTLLSVAAVMLSGCPIRGTQEPPPRAATPGSPAAAPTAAPTPGTPVPPAPPSASPAAPNAVTRAEGNAAQAGCVANAKQIGLAMMMYAQDYDERFPNPAKWHTGAMPYIRNEDVFHCPADKASGTSYAFNRNLGLMPLTKIARPSETIMAFESTLHAYDAFDLKGDVGASLPRPPRHDDGNSVAYVDGHVKLVPGVPDRSYWVPQAMPAPPGKSGK
jgi:prepilin-type processing-associated H-X9-DG protein